MLYSMVTTPSQISLHHHWAPFYHLDFFLVCDMSYGPFFPQLAVTSPFIKKFIFIPVVILLLLYNRLNSISTWVFFLILYTFHWSACLFMHQCRTYRNFIVYFNVGYTQFPLSLLAFLFKYFPGYSFPVNCLFFHIIFGINSFRFI